MANCSTHCLTVLCGLFWATPLFSSLSVFADESAPTSESQRTLVSVEGLVAEHQLTPTGNFVAIDLLHGQGGDRLRVERTWGGPDGGDGHFGPGWYDSNVIRVERETEDQLVVTRGPFVWVVANRSGEQEFTSQLGDVIRSGGGRFVLTRKSGASFSFDKKGRLQRIEPKTGPAADVSYSPEGRLLEVRIGRRNALRYVYEEDRVVGIEGPEGLRVDYVYKSGRLAEVINGWRHRIRYEHGEDGTLLSAVDQYANVATIPPIPPYQSPLVPPAAAALEETAAPEEAANQKVMDAARSADDDEQKSIAPANLPPSPIEVFDDLGRLARYEERGRTFEYEYDYAGRLKSEQAADGTTQWTYDEFGRQKTVRLPDGSSLTYSYNKLDQPVRIESSTGTWDAFEYDEHGNLILAAASDGRRESYAYDGRGRLSAVRPSVGTGEQYTYDENDTLTAIRFSNGQEMSLDYDADGRLVQTAWSTGQRTFRAYGPRGRLLSEKVNGLETTYGYDELGRLETITDPVHGEKRFDYSQEDDGLLRLTWGGTTWSRQTNEWTDPVETALTAEGIERRSLFLYHATGEVSDVSSPAGRFWSYLVDDAGRQIRIELPGGQGIDLERDHAGRVTKVTRDGVEYRTWLYDATGRVQMEMSPKGIAAVYSRDKAGRVREVIEPNGKVRYLYDERGLVTALGGDDYLIRQEHHPDGSLARRNYVTAGLDLRFSRDEAGRPAGISLNDIAVRYEYDEYSRVSSILLPGDARIWILRDQAGRPTEIAFGDHTRMGLTWDHRDRITSVGTSSGEEDYLTFLEQYEFDATGNLVHLQSLDQPTREMTYDADNRLISVKSQFAATDFEYDDNDNLTVVETGGVRSRWELDSGGRPRHLGTRASYIWDEGGNLVSISDLDLQAGNSFDAAGRLLHRGIGDHDWSFGYLPSGDRLWQEGPKGRTWYAYLRDGLTAIKDENDTPWLIVNLPGTDRPLAMCGPDNSTLFIVTDHLHSIRRVLDPAGQVLSSTEYGEYGQVAENRGSAPLAMYAGMVRDNHGLYYARRRYYDPALLRFISIDPWTGTDEFPASHNAYAYAANNPLRYRDPTGAAPEDAGRGSKALEEFLDDQYPDQLTDEALSSLGRKRDQQALLDSAAESRPVAPRMEQGDLDPLDEGGLPSGKRITQRRIPTGRHNPEHQRLIDEFHNAERNLRQTERNLRGLQRTPLNQRDIIRPLEERMERTRAALYEYEKNRFRGGGSSGAASQRGFRPGGGNGGSAGRGPGTAGQAARNTRPLPSSGQGGAAVPRDTRPLPRNGGASTIARDTRPLPVQGSTGAQAARDTQRLRTAGGPARASSFAPASQRQASALSRMRNSARGAVTRASTVANRVRNSEMAAAGVRTLGRAARFARGALIASALWHAAFDTTDPQEIARMSINDLVSLPGAVVDAVNEAPYFAERVYRAGDEAVGRLRNYQRREAAIREARAKLLEIFTDPGGQFEVVPNVVKTPGIDGAPGVFSEREVEILEPESPEFRWLAGLIRENVNNDRPALAGIVRRRSEGEKPDSGFNASIAKAKQELDERDRIAGEIFAARDKFHRELRAAIIELERAKRRPGAPSQDLADLKEAIEDLRTRIKGIQRMGNARQKALAKEIDKTAQLICKQADEPTGGRTKPPADLDPLDGPIGQRLSAPSPDGIAGSGSGGAVSSDEAILRAAEEKLSTFNRMLEVTRLPVEGLESSMQKVRRLRRKVDDESKRDKPDNDAGDVKEHLKSVRDHLSRASALRNSYNGMESQVKRAIQLRRSAWNRLVPWSRTQQAKALMERAFSDAKRPPGLLHKYDRPARSHFEIDRELRKIWNAGSEDAEEVLRDADESLDDAKNLLEQLREGDKSNEKGTGEDEAGREDDVYARLDQLKHCLGLLKKKKADGNSTPEVVSTDAFAALDPTYAFEKQVWTLTLIDKAEKPDDQFAPQGTTPPKEKLNPFEKQVWTLTLIDKDREEKKPKPIVPIVPESTFRPNDFDIAARPNKEPTQPATKYPFDIARPQRHEPSQPATKTPGEIALDPDTKTTRRIPIQPATKKPPRGIPSTVARSAPRLVTVPDVRGLSAQDAGKVISQATLGPTYALGAAAPRVPLQYQVYAQQPAPGARVLPGSGVRVIFFNEPSTQLVEPARRPTPTVASNQSVPKQPQVITQPATKNNPAITRTPSQPATRKAGEITPRVSSNDTPAGASNNRPVTPRVSSSATPSGSRNNPTRPVTPRVAGNSTPSSSSNTLPRKTTPQTPSAPSMVMVPNVTGMSAAEASKKLRSANLQPKLKYGQDAPDKDKMYKVYSQSPDGGRQTALNSAVAVTIYGQFRETASTRPANTPTRPNTQRITGKSTPSGSSNKPTRGVTPRSSSSPSMIEVPNVKGMSVAEAARKLRDAKLRAQFKIGTDAPSRDKTHEVYTQSPAGGQRLAPDSAVAVTIYSEFRPREIPEDFGRASLSHDPGSSGSGDMSRFEGEWICVSETLNGAKSNRFVGVKASIAGDNLTWTYRSGTREKCKFRIDDSKNPKHFDWWRPDQPPRLRLYEFVDENTLKWATNESSTSRPSSFDDARYVFICKRTSGKLGKRQRFEVAGVTVHNRTGETVDLDVEYRSNKSGSWRWYSTSTTIPSDYTGPLQDRSGATIAGSDIKLTATTASGRKVGSVDGSLLKDGRPYDADRMRMNDLNLTRIKEQ